MEFNYIAILSLIAFYGCYFDKMLRQKHQGIHTDQLGKGKSGFVWFIEVSLKIATALVAVADFVSIIIGTSVCPVSVRIIGSVMSIMGAVVFIISVQTMRDSWRAGISKIDKTELVTDGIYKISRNPAFLGFDLLYIGILLMFFNWILCVLTAISVVLFHIQIVYVEEGFLLETFEDEYQHYKSKVCRYFGRKII